MTWVSVYKEKQGQYRRPVKKHIYLYYFKVHFKYLRSMDGVIKSSVRWMSNFTFLKANSVSLTLSQGAAGLIQKVLASGSYNYLEPCSLSPSWSIHVLMRAHTRPHTPTHTQHVATNESRAKCYHCRDHIHLLHPGLWCCISDSLLLNCMCPDPWCLPEGDSADLKSLIHISQDCDPG